MRKRILVLDDVRTFAETADRIVTHARTVEDAVAELNAQTFDELWLDWDLSATRRYSTSYDFAVGIRAQFAGTVRIITDQRDGAATLARVIDDAIVTDAGVQ
jgi:hypothetical protein